MTEREVCEHCNLTFKTKFVLKTHLSTNKKCLALRGMVLKTEFICDGCKSMFITNNHLSIHQDSCKEYQQFIIEEKYQKELKEQQAYYEKELKDQRKEQELEYKEKLFKQDLEYKEKLKKTQSYYKEELIKIETKYEYIKTQYNEVREDYKNRQNKFDSILERIAINKPSTHINNTFQSQTTIEEIDENENTEIKEYKFGNTDFMVPIRSDGMINATALCKAGEKRLDHYKESPNTKAYLEELSLVTGIRVSNLFEANIGGQSGTWIHRKVGYHLAQWISPKFAVQVSTILDHLFIIGKVENYSNSIESLKENVSNSELETQYKEKIKCLTEENQSLTKKHISTLKTHRYIKFKDTDPCFYIIESGVSCDCGQPTIQYKFGIAGNDQNTIDDRLKSHRTLWPLLKVRFLLFMKDVVMIEKSFKMMYEKEINPNGHEIIEKVTLENMIDRINKLMEMLCITEYHIIPEEKLKEYNDYVDMTLKII